MTNGVTIIVKSTQTECVEEGRGSKKRSAPGRVVQQKEKRNRRSSYAELNRGDQNSMLIKIWHWIRVMVSAMSWYFKLESRLTPNH